MTSKSTFQLWLLSLTLDPYFCLLDISTWITYRYLKLNMLSSSSNLFALHFLSWLMMSHLPSHPGWEAWSHPRSLCLFCFHTHFISHQDLWILTTRTTQIIIDLTFPIPTSTPWVIWEKKPSLLDCGSLVRTAGPGMWHTDCFVNASMLLILLGTHTYTIIS